MNVHSGVHTQRRRCAARVAPQAHDGRSAATRLRSTRSPVRGVWSASVTAPTLRALDSGHASSRGDTVSDQPAGHYYAEGDPPGTVRYWDGTQWVGDPIPAPPSASPTPPSGSPVTASGSDSDRFAGLGVRIGASLIDAIVAIVAVLIIVVFVFTESTNDSFGSSANRSDGLIVGLLFYLVFLWMVVQFGGTPGTILGLRITKKTGRAIRLARRSCAAFRPPRQHPSRPVRHHPRQQLRRW